MFLKKRDWKRGINKEQTIVVSFYYKNNTRCWKSKDASKDAQTTAKNL